MILFKSKFKVFFAENFCREKLPGTARGKLMQTVSNSNITLGVFFKNFLYQVKNENSHKPNCLIHMHLTPLSIYFSFFQFLLVFAFLFSIFFDGYHCSILRVFARNCDLNHRLLDNRRRRLMQVTFKIDVHFE